MKKLEANSFIVSYGGIMAVQARALSSPKHYQAPCCALRPCPGLPFISWSSVGSCLHGVVFPNEMMSYIY